MLVFFLDVTVTVVGGAGSSIFWNVPDDPPDGFVAGFSADLISVCAKGPSNTTPTFGWALLDAAGFAVAGRSELSGDTTTDETKTIYPRGSMTVFSATIDGLYQFRVYARQNKQT